MSGSGDRSCTRPSWGWLVVIGAFVSNFVSIGTLKSFGVLLPYLVNGLHTDTTLVGLTVGMLHGFSVGFAIVTNQVLKVVSARWLTMIGGLLASMGYCACVFITSGGQFVVVCIMSAIGNGLMILSVRVTVVRYFPDNFFIATSVMLTGGGVGMMVLPPVTEVLARVYGWRGTLLLLGGINSHIMIGGALLRPPTYWDTESDAKNDDEDDEEEGAGSEVGVDTDGKEPESDRPEVTPNGQEDTAITHLSSQLIETDSTEQAGAVSCCESILRALDLRIFYDFPMFSLTIVAVFVHGITYIGWIVFLVPNAVAKGFPPSRAVYLATIGGACNVIGRLAVGFILRASEGAVSPIDAFAFSLFISSVAFFMSPITDLFWVLALAAVLNGVSNGAKTVLVTLVSRAMVTPDRFSTALSFAMFVRGFSEPIGGLMTGWLYQKTNSYNEAFLLLGGLDAVGLIAILIGRCAAWRQSESQRI